MRKIKVAFFAEILIEDFDGASRTMFQIIHRIPGDEFEFLFICGNGPEEIAGFECLRIPSAKLPVNKGYTIAIPQLADTSLREKLHDFAPDIIHIATPSLLGSFALNFAQQHKLPVLSIYHTHFISYIDYYLNKAPFLIDFAKSRVGAAHKNFYNRCDLVYVPSESIAAELCQIGFERARIKIWKRGMDTFLFSPEKRNVAGLQAITGNTSPNILFASRLVWEKNLETLIRIYEHCRDANLPYNFIIAGDGGAREACQKRMPHAVFTGSLAHEALAELYASADIFLFTSVSETFGNVVAEAMASGLPCVIADGGGSADFITNGENGFKCPPMDEVSYVEKMGLILQDKQLASQFSQSARAQCLKLDWNELTNIYFEDLHQLVSVLQA